MVLEGAGSARINRDGLSYLRQKAKSDASTRTIRRAGAPSRRARKRRSNWRPHGFAAIKGAILLKRLPSTGGSSPEYALALATCLMEEREQLRTQLPLSRKAVTGRRVSWSKSRLISRIDGATTMPDATSGTARSRTRKKGKGRYFVAVPYIKTDQWVLWPMIALRHAH